MVRMVLGDAKGSLVRKRSIGLMKEIKKKFDKEKSFAKEDMFPNIVADAISYFTKEEAKITSSAVMKGGLALTALGLMSFPETVMSAHESLHVSWNSHANRAAETYHINIAAVNQHANANVHTNAGAIAAHSNIDTHTSSAAVDTHSNVNAHTSAAAVNTHASKPAINVGSVHASSSVVKGGAHNSGTQGKHTAWTAHSSQSTSAHTNTAAATVHNNVAASSVHSNINTHASAGAVDHHRNHNSAVSIPAVNRHANIQTHANALASDVHANISSYNILSNANSHGSHDSHSSW
jgi:hypothetical protein